MSATHYIEQVITNRKNEAHRHYFYGLVRAAVAAAESACPAASIEGDALSKVSSHLRRDPVDPAGLEDLLSQQQLFDMAQALKQRAQNGRADTYAAYSAVYAAYTMKSVYAAFGYRAVMEAAQFAEQHLAASYPDARNRVIRAMVMQLSLCGLDHDTYIEMIGGRVREVFS